VTPTDQARALEPALAALVGGFNRDPFAVLGPHGDLVRVFQPSARAIDLRLVTTGERLPMTRRDGAGIFEVRLPTGREGRGGREGREGQDLPGSRGFPDYRLRITYPGDHVVEIDDPYRYGRVLTDFDLHLLGEGTHHRAFEKLGAHRLMVGTTAGVHFAVWAPNADRVSVIGDFNAWDGRVHAMRLLSPGGIWEIFIPNLAEGEKYKFEVRARSGAILKKTDPYGVAFEVPPLSAAIVRDISRYTWHDAAWMEGRPAHGAWLEQPMSIYEVHLGSWARVPERATGS
jgi:1,4-alpha-glucan branching enzyme